MRHILTTLFVFILITSFAGEKPNVVVVLCDDIGTGDISHYRRMHSSNIILETPNIDQLATTGMVFTQVHSPAALCAPARYGVMTGNNCYRSRALWGVWGSYEASPIKDTDLTLGRLMKDAGYNTAFFGKWNLGGDFYRLSNPNEIYRAPRVQPELDIDITKIIDGPLQKGFDYSLTFPAGIQDVPYAVYENNEWMPLAENSEITHITQAKMDALNVTLDKDEGLGDSNWDPHNMGPLLAQKGVEYIKHYAHKEKPFFMYYCSQSAHLPHTPPVELNGVKIAGTTPSAHMDMIKELDVQMGMLIDELKAQGVYNNTVFIFTSDNGGLAIKETLNSGHRPNSIYRGNKNTRWEGGHRVPFIVSWPDSLESGQTNVPALSLDIASTLAAISKTPIKPGQALDSYNLLPTLKKEEDATNHAFLITQGGTGKELVIIEDGWKLILQTNSEGTDREPIALYDLNTNIQEKESANYINDAAYKDKIEALLNKYNYIRDNDIPTNDLGTSVDTTKTDTVMVSAEEVNYVDFPSSFLASDLNITVKISYQTKEERDISLEIKTPEGTYVKHVQKAFPAGKHESSISLQLNTPLPAATNYNIALALRPIGKTWKENIDVKKTTFSIVNATSVKSLPSQNVGMELFPNPLTGNTLTLTHAAKGRSTLRIFDLSGILQYKHSFKGPSVSMPLKQILPSGIYFAALHTAQGSETQQLIVD